MLELSDLGSRLRMAREEKSLTLDELQAITRIQKRYLSAIEEGNFEVMPGKFYTRAFIKQYAEAVDLEPEVLFEEYKNEIPIAYEDDLPEQLTRVQSRNSVSRKGSKLIEFFPKILMAIFFIAIIVLVWYLVTNFLISNDKDAVNDEPNTSIDISESDDVPSTDSSADDKGNEGQTDSQRIKKKKMMINQKRTKNRTHKQSRWKMLLEIQQLMRFQT